MRTILTGMLCFFLAMTCCAQINIYDASTLADTLKKNAHSVKREETITFTVKDKDQAKLTVHRVFTALDGEGEEALFFVMYSDEFRKLDDADIRVYDAHGNSINRYKLKEIASEATGDGLVVDGKVYFFRVAAPSYPMTVQFDYVVKYKGTLNYPDYHIEVPEQSVENSSYTVTVPADLDLRYKAQNISLPPAVENTGKNKVYSWKVKNLPAVPYEEGAVSYESSYPAILLAPNEFSMDGNDGNLSTWKSFGEWFAGLEKGSITLPDKTVALLKSLVKDAGNDQEKISILYDYLQTNCRYVSIQLGIGGYKPFDAEFVDEKKYGDCKALSNYMQAMLSAVGIRSYQALINAEYNRQPVDPAFPHNSFNHVILCVPGNKDTTWLECTSKATVPGVLGSFTENRNALLITPDGGVLVATPRSTSSENIFNLTTRIKLSEDASGQSESVLKTRGEFREEIIGGVADEKKDDQKKYLVRRLGFSQPDDFMLSCDTKNDSARTTFSLLMEKVPEFTAGSKMFLNPRIYRIWNGTLPTTKKRTKPYYFEYPFLKDDTTVYQLPENYTVENLPKARDLKCAYGRFITRYTYDEKSNTVTSTALLELTCNKIPADQFEETRNFFSEVGKEYTDKIVVRKK
jgi:hypothetical protein